MKTDKIMSFKYFNDRALLGQNFFFVKLTAADHNCLGRENRFFFLDQSNCNFAMFH